MIPYHILQEIPEGCNSKGSEQKMLNKGVAGLYKLLVLTILVIILLSFVTANIGWFGIIAIITALAATNVWQARRNSELRTENRRLEGELRRTAYWHNGP